MINMQPRPINFKEETIKEKNARELNMHKLFTFKPNVQTKRYYIKNE